jgi:intracellular sulfur oxidation DsrE/DsrF family protein
MKTLLLIATLMTCFFTPLNAQEAERIKGPVIQDYGATFAVESPDWIQGMETELKVIYDVGESSDDRKKHNQNLEFAARFLNLHVRSGMSIDNLKAAMTIHAKASHDVLSDEAYRARFGVDNPNTQLINELTAAGVDLVLCGQAATKRNIKRAELHPNIKVAPSATTAIIQYQNMGYGWVKY